MANFLCDYLFCRLRRSSFISQNPLPCFLPIPPLPLRVSRAGTIEKMASYILHHWLVLRLKCHHFCCCVCCLFGLKFFFLKTCRIQEFVSGSFGSCQQSGQHLRRGEEGEGPKDKLGHFMNWSNWRHEV